jgi:hypothetical protein
LRSALLLQLENAAAKLSLALLKLADDGHVVVPLALHAAQFGLAAVHVAQLVGEAAAQRLDVHFEPAGGEGELGAQLILVGAELGHGDRRRRLDALLGEAHRALPDRGHDDQAQKPGDQHPQGEVHDVLDEHNSTPRPRGSVPSPRQSTENDIGGRHRATVANT